MFASPSVDGRRSIYIRSHANDHFGDADQGANVVDDRYTIVQSCFSVSLRTMLKTNTRCRAFSDTKPVRDG